MGVLSGCCWLLADDDDPITADTAAARADIEDRITRLWIYSQKIETNTAD